MCAGPAQCNALHRAMPFLFESIDDETELLLPDHLLHSDSLVRKLVQEIPEEDWQEVEIIGWLYQFYISEKKDEVIGKVVKSEDIPAATQLFTPNWIVKYLVQNSLGRQWVATYPNSPLKQQMEYYIKPAEQTPQVQAQLDEITPASLNPEELTLLDPACGSGHILVEAYDLLKAIYQERGYRAKDIPRLILEKNLFGLEIDDRAAQLAAFALTMKARADDRSIFDRDVQLHVLSIQESKGLDAQEITEALNQPILNEEPPPTGELFEEIADEKAPLFSKKTMGIKGGVSQADVARLIDLFEHGKTFGSLIQVPDTLAEKLPAIMQRVEGVIAHGGMLEKAAASPLVPVIQQALTLAGEYDAVVANPPYMGSRYLNQQLKQFVKDQYLYYDKDLFSAFIFGSRRFAKKTGHLGFMSPFVWMFISSHEHLRTMLIEQTTITSLIQLEYSGFAEATVPICTFTFSSYHVKDFTGAFIRLTTFTGAENQSPKTLEAIRNPDCGWIHYSRPDDFKLIPGSPIAYWASREMRMAFAKGTPLFDIARPRQGMATTKNDLFLRRWFEVDHSRIGFGHGSLEQAYASGKKWFPYNKGGAYRRWYGNNEYIVNFEDGGRTVCDYIDNDPNAKVGSNGRIINREYYFKKCITWTDISSSQFGVRRSDQGFIFDISGSSAFPSVKVLNLVAAFLCSRLAFEFLKVLNPTLHFQVGNIGTLPFFADGMMAVNDQVNKLVDEAVAISRKDWDNSETSWDFVRPPLMKSRDSAPTVGESLRESNSDSRELTRRMLEIEEENNRAVLSVYGLLDRFSPEVSEDQITLYSPDRKEDIRRLISYSIGCMMGRYSLDEPGLIYAHSGNERFWEVCCEKHGKNHELHESHELRKEPNSESYSCYSCYSWSSFPPDEDGIVPLTEFHWFEDDAAKRFEKFIATAWPTEHLQENLQFVAESLGAKKGESPRETTRRYLAAGFFKHHLKLYKKRPIYWLFSSGKQRGFQALVYLHRYNEGTLSRMRTEYVIPLLGKMTARIDQLTDDIAGATSSQHRKRLEREKSTLTKQLAEVQAYDEKLRHYADQRITLDLDDGVKVNYGKFGDLLAEVKAVTGKKATD